MSRLTRYAIAFAWVQVATVIGIGLGILISRLPDVMGWVFALAFLAATIWAWGTVSLFFFRRWRATR